MPYCEACFTLDLPTIVDSPCFEPDFVCLNMDIRRLHLAVLYTVHVLRQTGAGWGCVYVCVCGGVGWLLKEVVIV